MWWEAHQVETLGSPGPEKRGAARAHSRQEEAVWLETNVTSGRGGRKLHKQTKLNGTCQVVKM